jgi:hypothetical protein
MREGAQTNAMINRYRTSSTRGTRSLRASLMLLSQGIAIFSETIGMILCGDNGLGRLFTHKPQGSNWLNSAAAAIFQDSPRFAYAYVNVVVSDDSGEPSRAWSQGRWQKREKRKP